MSIIEGLEHETRDLAWNSKSHEKKCHQCHPVSPARYFPVSNAIYSIRANDDRQMLYIDYEHCHHWVMGTGHARVLIIGYLDRPIKALVLPKSITDDIEAKYTGKDNDYKDIGPWAEIGLAAIMRAGDRLKGKEPKIRQLVQVVKLYIHEIILEDIGVDIAELARAKAKEAKARC